KHSTVWNGGDTLFDINFQALGIEPDECFKLARGKVLKPGSEKTVDLAPCRRREHVGERQGLHMQAGYVNSDGYRDINIDGTEYFAQDLIWLWMTGKFPQGRVEHINGIKDDNRWCNLRISSETTKPT